jgi:hypothetical protein
MKQPVYLLLFLALIVLLAIVVVRPDLVIGRVFGGGARTLEQFARDQGVRTLKQLLTDRDWTRLESEEHPALKPGFAVTVWGSHRMGGERLRGITKGDDGWVFEEPEQLVEYLRPVNSADAARAVSDLVRRVVPGLTGPMNAKVGTILSPSTDPSGRFLHGGRYQPEDAKKWDVKLGVSVKPAADGFRIERVALLPVDAGNPGQGWVVALIEEAIGRDGSFSFKPVRTLAEDARGFLVTEW